MKTGIVGAGSWGINLVRNFCKILGTNNVLVCDSDKKRLSSIESAYTGIKTYTKHDEIVGSDRRP